jgi:cobalt-zinc-cadmium efflux system membrane fusion protein
MNTSLCTGFCIAAVGVLMPACHQSHAATERLPPPGQVWLTPRQVRQENIEVGLAVEQAFDDAVVTSGRVVLDDLRSGHVYSPVTGRVVRIAADLGQRVKAGDPLAVIESPDVGSAVSDVHKAEADLIAAQHDYQRKKELFEQRACSEADLEVAEDNYRRARAEIERARQKAALLHHGGVDSVTQTYTLVSPVDGEVLLRNITPGVEVQGQYSGGAAQELFTIGEVDKVWVFGDLYEADVARVQVGGQALVSVIPYPDKVLRGRVDWVSGMLDPATRTAKVRCTFDNPDRLLRPEMYATMKVSVAEKRTLAIPRDAVVRLGEYRVVFLEVGESEGLVKFERMPVDVEEVGASRWVAVKHGLSPLQSVVVSGAGLLSQKL